MLIELLDVSFTYMPGTHLAKRALSDVTLSVAEGEYVALVGPTGSGKSTLIQHLNGLLSPTSGRMVFQGREVGDELHPSRLREEVGLVFQFPENQLFEETVEDDVAFGPRNLGVPEDEVLLRVEEALGQVGLDYREFAPRSPFSLSGGEMRLVAIAGVLAMRPRVLVLDEPTSGLDARGRGAVFETLARLNRDGVTVIIVTHSLDEVAEAARRVVVLRDGRVVADESPRHMFTRSQLLLEAGLGVPATTELLTRLKACGLDVPVDVVGLDETVDAVRTALKERAL